MHQRHRYFSHGATISALVCGLIAACNGATANVETPPPSLQPTADLAERAHQLAAVGVESNADWQPYTEVFDGVEMALVPAGCFQLGSSMAELDAGMEFCAHYFDDCTLVHFINQAPQTEICFTSPFWVDVTEVTNTQYGSAGEWTGDTLPRESISWFEAQEHCEQRGARLPAEAEWEYAARGPDRLRFPWGEEFDATRTNYCDRNCDFEWADDTGNDGFEHTAPVGTFPTGVSWVGALDMAGNVWEWISSAYLPYPYDSADGRENLEDLTVRGLRGGAWRDTTLDVFTSYRFGSDPNFTSSGGGFRCVRDY